MNLFSPSVLHNLTQQIPYEKSLALDLEALMSSYPGFFSGVEIQGQNLYLVMKDQTKLIYNDHQSKSFEQRLEKPDVKDMLGQLYRPGEDRGPFRPDHDPGRFRIDPFFKAIYGASAKEVAANLTRVRFDAARVMFNARNGAARALEDIGQELTALLKKQPQLREYCSHIGGTFNPRKIAGTDRMSPHSWGIAIDLNPRFGAYWRDRKLSGAQVEELSRKFPLEIVEIFEKHGFIWGGKWSHFDLMHFEYRPELLRKWQLSSVSK
jgi:hypothetical protein